MNSWELCHFDWPWCNPWDVWQESHRCFCPKRLSRWWFQIFFIFTRVPLEMFRWVIQPPPSYCLLACFIFVVLHPFLLKRKDGKGAALGWKKMLRPKKMCPPSIEGREMYRYWYLSSFSPRFEHFHHMFVRVLPRPVLHYMVNWLVGEHTPQDSWAKPGGLEREPASCFRV